MKRMRVPVITRQNPQDLTSYTWYYIDCLVLPTTVRDALEATQSGIEIRDEINLYTKEEQPQIRVLDSKVLKDYVYWDNKWYSMSGQAKYAKLGRSSYRHIVLNHILSDETAATFPLPPPDFKEGYLDFLDSVGTLTNAVELPLINLCKQIEECAK